MSLLQLPVAERQEDIFKLQPLALMDRQDAHTLLVFGLYGTFGIVLFPFLHQSVNVGG